MKDWIRSARTHAKLTQEQLAERLGLTKGNVSAWENGRHEASHEQLIRLVAITNYREPLPGLSMPVSALSAEWPYPRIDENKFRNLDDRSASALEAIILLGAAQVGLDIKKHG